MIILTGFAAEIFIVKLRNKAITTTRNTTEDFIGVSFNPFNNRF
jgi:hypothetical protein